MNEKQLAAAGMLGRGRSTKKVHETLDVSTCTIERWRKLPDFAAEVARVRASSERPNARGVLLDALFARRDDGVDWSARLRAAQQLLALAEDDPEVSGPRSVLYVPRDDGSAAGDAWPPRSLGARGCSPHPGGAQCGQEPGPDCTRPQHQRMPTAHGGDSMLAIKRP
jgi:hypothetical protein